MTARTISAGETRLSGTPRTTAVVQASGVSQLGNTVLPLRQNRTTLPGFRHRIVETALQSVTEQSKLGWSRSLQASGASHPPDLHGRPAEHPGDDPPAHR